MGRMPSDELTKVVSVLREYGLEPVEAGPDTWKTDCPAHSNDAFELTVGCDTNGRLIPDCRRRDTKQPGCSHADLLAALGITDPIPQTQTGEANVAGQTDAELGRG